MTLQFVHLRLKRIGTPKTGRNVSIFLMGVSSDAIEIVDLKRDDVALRNDRKIRYWGSLGTGDTDATKGLAN
jgi:hypothetical protein